MEQPFKFGKNFWIWVAVLAVIAAFLIWVFVAYANRPVVGAVKPSAGLTLFYGDTCPHCQKVEAYLNETPGTDKLNVIRLEVYNDKINAQVLAAKAKICKLDTSSIGVPFLWTGETCLVGDGPIIDYFNARLK
jgi:glutaredoxin